ncbi:transmembrane matrix receptor MUP-4-like [Sycon ciliatum]|uniref:transmembrane matrix receptor MUP-4-like n=1 Tax=Sycon ciliatum TaxID=27933 RepID=UPI0031F60C44
MWHWRAVPFGIALWLSWVLSCFGQLTRMPPCPSSMPVGTDACTCQQPVETVGTLCFGIESECEGVPGTNDRFFCNCPLQFPGAQCEANLQVCSTVADCNQASRTGFVCAASALTGDRRCTCAPGFRIERRQPSGRNVCLRDECADPALNNCNINASCKDTDNGFLCECNAGFRGDGVQCVRQQENDLTEGAEGDAGEDGEEEQDNEDEWEGQMSHRPEQSMSSSESND